MKFRPLLPRDRRFVVSAWSRTLRGTEHAGLISDDTWPTVMHAQIESLLDRMHTTVAYAPDADPVAELYGFITYGEGPLVCFCYVKQAYRRSGVARGLFKAAGIDPAQPFSFACRTLFVDELARKIPRAVFAPQLARAVKEKA